MSLTICASTYLSPLNIISCNGVQHLRIILFFTIRDNVRVGTNTILICKASPQFSAASYDISELKVRLNHLLLTLVSVKNKNRYLEKICHFIVIYEHVSISHDIRYDVTSILP